MNCPSEAKRDHALNLKQKSPQSYDPSWLGLMIGNSRLHWAWFMGEKLCAAWDTEYLPESASQLIQGWDVLEWGAEFFPPDLISQYNARLLPLYVASVVPKQTALWQNYPDIHMITLDQVPLQGVYPTLGIDRALALWGAGETWGWPMLVIDAGTALTFTGGDANRCLVGGAILPGLGFQLQSLAQRTAGLPLVETRELASLPPRWALKTPEAIHSGVIYTMLAGIRDFVEAWWQKFPGSCITLTGGDRAALLSYLQFQYPRIAAGLITDPHLVFWGMRFCRAGIGT